MTRGLCKPVKLRIFSNKMNATHISKVVQLWASNNDMKNRMLKTYPLKH